MAPVRGARCRPFLLCTSGGRAFATCKVASVAVFFGPRSQAHHPSLARGVQPRTTIWSPGWADSTPSRLRRAVGHARATSAGATKGMPVNSKRLSLPCAPAVHRLFHTAHFSMCPGPRWLLWSHCELVFQSPCAFTKGTERHLVTAKLCAVIKWSLGFPTLRRIIGEEDQEV